MVVLDDEIMVRDILIAYEAKFTYFAVLVIVKQCISSYKPEVVHEKPPRSEKGTDLSALLRACGVTIQHFVIVRDAIAVTVHTYHFEQEIFLPFMNVLNSRKHVD